MRRGTSRWVTGGQGQRPCFTRASGPLPLLAPCTATGLHMASSSRTSPHWNRRILGPTEDIGDTRSPLHQHSSSTTNHNHACHHSALSCLPQRLQRHKFFVLPVPREPPCLPPMRCRSNTPALAPSTAAPMSAAQTAASGAPAARRGCARCASTWAGKHTPPTVPAAGWRPCSPA